MKFTIGDDDAPQIYLNPVIEKIALKYNFTILQTLKAMQDGYNYYRDEKLGVINPYYYDYEEWNKDVYETFGFWIMPKGGGVGSDSIFYKIKNLISFHGVKAPLNSAFDYYNRGLVINLIEVAPIGLAKDVIQIYIKGWYFTPGLFIFKEKNSKAGYFLNWVEYPFANPLQ